MGKLICTKTFSKGQGAKFTPELSIRCALESPILQENLWNLWCFRNSRI